VDLPDLLGEGRGGYVIHKDCCACVHGQIDMNGRTTCGLTKKSVNKPCLAFAPRPARFGGAKGEGKG
jgi:hypothetical protein